MPSLAEGEARWEKCIIQVSWIPWHFSLRDSKPHWRERQTFCSIITKLRLVFYNSLEMVHIFTCLHYSPVRWMFLNLIDGDFEVLRKEATCSRVHSKSGADRSQSPGAFPIPLFWELILYHCYHSREPNSFHWASIQHLDFLLYFQLLME